MAVMWKDEKEREELARFKRAEEEMMKQTCKNRLGTGLTSMYCPNCDIREKGKCFYPERVFPR